MKQKTAGKNPKNRISHEDFLYDELDEQTLLAIDNDIQSSDNDEEDENEQNQKEDYKSITADDSVKAYLQQIGKIPLLSFEDELEIARQIKENQ